MWVKAHHTEVSLIPESSYKFSKTDFGKSVWEGPTQKVKRHISNFGRQQSGFIRKLEKDVSDTEI